MYSRKSRRQRTFLWSVHTTTRICRRSDRPTVAVAETVKSAGRQRQRVNSNGNTRGTTTTTTLLEAFLFRQSASLSLLSFSVCVYISILLFLDIVSVNISRTALWKAVLRKRYGRQLKQIAIPSSTTKSSNLPPGVVATTMSRARYVSDNITITNLCISLF